MSTETSDKNVASEEDIKILNNYLKNSAYKQSNSDFFKNGGWEIVDLEVPQAIEHLIQDYTRHKQINEEHQKINAKLRKKVRELEDENYMQKVALLEESIPKQKIKDKIEKLKNKLKFIACFKDCNKCFDKKGKVLYRGSDFIPCYAYHQIKILQELLED